MNGKWGNYDKTGVKAKAIAAAASKVPVLIGATPSAGQITVKWNKVDGAKKYAVYRKVSGGSWERLTSSVTGTSYTDKSADLEAGTTYIYTVKAYVDGKWGNYDKTGVNAKAQPKWEPDISFTTMDATGKQWTDACFRDAKITMVNLWAYWCPPCCDELPDLQQLSLDYAERGLQILGISDAAYEVDNVAKMAELGVTYPCLRYTAPFYDYMDTGYVPTTIFVDENGKVIGEAIIGSRSYEGWAAYIESLLS